MSGFPKRRESALTTAFDTGHSSTSISAGLGLAHGQGDQLGEHYTVVSVIGDGAPDRRDGLTRHLNNAGQAEEVIF